MTSIDFDQIAAQIHEFYFRQYGGIFPATYAELPEFMRADNRAAARRISAVLAIAGLQLVPREGTVWDDQDRQSVRAIMEANLERMAEAEHDGWISTRLRQGWMPAPPPASSDESRANVERRLHHLLIPYAALPDKQKNKDRDSVRNFIEIVGSTAYRIVPIDQPSAC